jgi:hypothetical protein
MGGDLGELIESGYDVCNTSFSFPVDSYMTDIFVTVETNAGSQPLVDLFDSAGRKCRIIAVIGVRQRCAIVRHLESIEWPSDRQVLHSGHHQRARHIYGIRPHEQSHSVSPLFHKNLPDPDSGVVHTI